MTNNNVLPATLSALLRDYSVAEGIQMAEQQAPGTGLPPPQPVSVVVRDRRLVAGAATDPAVRPDGRKLYPRGSDIWGADTL